MRARWRIWSVVTGVCLAAVYSLTPLTICVVAAAAATLPLFAKGLPGPERRWLTAIVAAALVARLLAIGVVFARNLPTHDDQFAGATSGDEAYTMGRALRTRDIVRGSTTNNYDFFIAFDEYGRNSYVAALTAAQVIFGPTPYSLRLLNTLLFTVGALLLFRERTSGARLGVDPDGVAAEELRGFGPLVVVLDGLPAFGLVRVAQRAFVVAHDEQDAHALAVGALLELGEVGSVLRLVHEELVDEFDGLDTKFLPRRLWEVEVVEFLAEEGLVERPFGEGDLEEGLL